MPRKRELTWHKARKCWKRTYKGRTYYFAKGQCRGKTDEAGYQQALHEFHLLRVRLDREARGVEQDAAVEVAAQQVPPRRPFMAPFGEQSFAAPVGTGPMPMEAEFGAYDTEIPMATDYARLGFTPTPLNGKPPTEIMLTELVEQYLVARRVDVEAGKLSVAMYGQDKCKAEDFLAFAADQGVTMASQIAEPLLDFYRQIQLKLTVHEDTDARISGETAKKRLATIARVIRWGYKRRYVGEMPRNLDREFAAVPIPEPEPNFLSVDEVRQVFLNASTRTRLYILLALNAGYTQREIALLEHAHVDWDTGVITRKRPKTSKPQVHKLWPSTLKLLRAEATPGGPKGLVLLGAKGNPLIVQEVRTDGMLRHNDTIRLAYARVVKKLGHKGLKWAFKTLRKTGCDLIAQEYQKYPHVTDQYLAHGEKKMSRHYCDEHFDLLFEALAWLDKQFHLDDLLPKRPPTPKRKKKEVAAG